MAWQVVFAFSLQRYHSCVLLPMLRLCSNANKELCAWSVHTMQEHTTLHIVYTQYTPP